MKNTVRSLRPFWQQWQKSRGVAPVASRPAAMMEPVEPRLLFAVFTVTTVADAGPGSFRQAILDANLAAGSDDIAFAIPDSVESPGVIKTITPLTPLPTITGVVSIDGSTQPGYQSDPNVLATPVIQINGASAGAGANGLIVATSDPGIASNIVALAINRFSGNGLVINGDGNFVAECFIGTNTDGTAAGPGNGGHGILIDNGDNNYVYENVLAFNTGDGIALTNTSTGNDVDLNSFFSNGGLAVDFNNDGVTPNDVGDGDTGVNTLQNAPVLTSATPATGGGLTVTGTINTTPNTLVTITFYSTNSATAAEAEGKVIHQTIEVTTDGAGNGSFTEVVDTAVTDFVTATATSLDFPGDLSIINSSEFSNAVPNSVTPPGKAAVTQVFVNGGALSTGTTAAAAAFRAKAGIDSTFGYPIPAAGAQLKSIPWTGGVSQIALRFDNDIASELQIGDLVVRGSTTPTYTVTAFTYDAATKTGVWTLSAAIFNDKVRLFLDDAAVPSLDGEWTNPATTAGPGDAYPSGDGTTGGDFNFRFNVLRGDATQDGTVNAQDLAFIKQRLNKTALNPGTTGAVYSAFGDLTMDGSINAQDLSAAKQRLNNKLPTADPATALLFSARRVS